MSSGKMGHVLMTDSRGQRDLLICVCQKRTTLILTAIGRNCITDTETPPDVVYYKLDRLTKP